MSGSPHCISGREYHFAFGFEFEVQLHVVRNTYAEITGRFDVVRAEFQNSSARDVIAPGLIPNFQVDGEGPNDAAQDSVLRFSAECGPSGALDDQVAVWQAIDHRHRMTFLRTRKKSLVGLRRRHLL